MTAESAPSAAAEQVGVCDGPTARGIFYDTVATVILPGLEQRGLPASRAWQLRVRPAA